jgi:uncharacterized protein YndB with AHSA1/START domain
MITLVVRRTIRATREQLFDAWTQPEQLRRWWGPRGVVCTAAEVNLFVGGTYRIANRFPDASVVWIHGEFEVIERPARLVYTWQLERQSVPERVHVAFVACPGGTEVTVTHERIPDAPSQKRHESGWVDCLEGLCRYVEVG